MRNLYEISGLCDRWLREEAKGKPLDAGVTAAMSRLGAQLEGSLIRLDKLERDIESLKRYARKLKKSIGDLTAGDLTAGD